MLTTSQLSLSLSFKCCPYKFAHTHLLKKQQLDGSKHRLCACGTLAWSTYKSVILFSSWALSAPSLRVTHRHSTYVAQAAKLAIAVPSM